MMEELLRELVEFVKTASPELWAILIKQVKVEAVTDAMWVGAFLLCVWLLYKFVIRRILMEEDDFDRNMELGFAWLVEASLLLTAFRFTIGIVRHLSNPEFYCIQYIIGQLTSH